MKMGQAHSCVREASGGRRASADRTAALSFDRNSRQANAYGVLAKDARQLVVGCRSYAAVASG